MSQSSGQVVVRDDTASDGTIMRSEVVDATDDVEVVDVPIERESMYRV